MVKKKQTVLLFLLATVFLLLPAVGPAVNAADTGSAKPLVVDMAKSFTAEQTRNLSEEAKALSSRYGMDIVIVTTADTKGKSSRDYADDYFDDNGYGVGEERNGILFLLDLDNREAYISTSGSGIRYLTDARIEDVLDDIFAGGLSKGDYFGAAKAFISSTGEFLAAGIPAGQYTVSEPEANSLTAAEAAAGAGVSLILGPTFYAVVRRQYRGNPKPGIFNFHHHSLLNLGVTTDNLVNSYVTSRVLPKQNTSSGGNQSTVHRSSSGRSHGGGGRKF